jgi:hypothetical protein
MEPQSEAESANVPDGVRRRASLAEQLGGLVGRHVVLGFRDGEMVEAVLLGVDVEWQKDILYEVIAVIADGDPRPIGAAPGARCRAPLREVIACTAVEPEG